MTNQFKSAVVASKLTTACIKFDKYLAKINRTPLTKIRQKLRQELNTYRHQGMLSVVVVGQYGAGKSTLISALTGRRDIAIHSDITTDQISRYNWQGIEVIDTPGLFTERQDHDQITYSAIAKADLVIFCLTSMLFDAITVENFKQLAYHQGYRWKMMLVINKMSEEAGEDSEKMVNYRRSLAEALHPYNLDEFPICFIDAKDYCEGIDSGDKFLRDVSRFSTFIQTLDTWVEQRGYLTRFDTPIRIALSCVDDAQFHISRTTPQDSVFLELLTRLTRSLHQERDRLRTKIQGIILHLSAAITQEGDTLQVALGSQLNFEQLTQRTELNIQNHYEQACEKITNTLNQAMISLHQTIVTILKGTLVQLLLESWEQAKPDNHNPGNSKKSQRIHRQLYWLKTFRDTVEAMSENYPQNLAEFQVKPWQSVEAMTPIIHISHFLSSATIIFSEKPEPDTGEFPADREKQMNDIIRYITSQFQAIAKHLEHQINAQLWTVEQQTYRKLEQQISVRRQQELDAIAGSNKDVKQLAEIRRDFERILQYISKATVKSSAFPGTGDG
ncbi:MAG: GTPase [Coleofasciculus chthonoplastes F3-SA18-01]|uniref:GTPase n=1 Tax=Coleofasciculus chthonoplastes TaxID=64178 RepID=UPI0032F8CD42